MQLITQSSFSESDSPAISSFIEEVVGDDALRIDKDYGSGFVKLKISEAERRQAAQDICSVEDALIELLRNSRDAGAKHIFVATQKESSIRTITVLDDGCGMPVQMHELVFEPRVTSKLNTSTKDMWGYHGRGMALYSIKHNAKESYIVFSEPGVGSSIYVSFDTDKIPEKTDQSTFPELTIDGNSASLRGPKNMLRCCSEFAIEHRGTLDVYFGSNTEIAAALISYGNATTNASTRAFCDNTDDILLIQRLAFCANPSDMSDLAKSIGLDISSRSCRRILDGEIVCPPTLMDRIKADNTITAKSNKCMISNKHNGPTRIKFAENDMDEFRGEVAKSFAEIAEKYYLDKDIVPSIHASGGSLKIEIPLIYSQE